jgi:hypothetical protein
MKSSALDASITHELHRKAWRRTQEEAGGIAIRPILSEDRQNWGIARPRWGGQGGCLIRNSVID